MVRWSVCLILLVASLPLLADEAELADAPHPFARDAIGARVKLTTASSRVLYNHVSVSVGFMSSSDKRVHFGLGQDSTVASLEIRWPSGPRQVLKDIAADQLLKIDEPAQ